MIRTILITCAINICSFVFLFGCASQQQKAIEADKQYLQMRARIAMFLQMLEKHYSNPLYHHRLDMILIILQEQKEKQDIDMEDSNRRIKSEELRAFSGAEIFENLSHRE